MTHRQRLAETGRTAWNPLTLVVLSGLWMAGAANWPLWRTLLALPEMATPRGALVMAGLFVIIAALTIGMLAAFAWRGSVKPMLTWCLVTSAVAAHFMGTYGVVIDPPMMGNLLQTDLREVRDLLGPRLGFSVLLMAGLPIAWLWRQPLRCVTAWSQLRCNLLGMTAAVVIATVLVFLLFADIAATMRNHKSIRYLINPMNSFYALGVTVRHATAQPARLPLPAGLDAAALPRPGGAKPPLVMLVVGETARADHFSLNGYARPTNPELAQRDVLSFSNVTSCGTHTAASLPCMFSHLGREGFEALQEPRENLLDVLQRAGLAVLWIDNQSGCKGVCERVPHVHASEAVPGAQPLPEALCQKAECLDEALLHGLDDRLANLSPERRARGVVIVLHQMGSHGPAYHLRSPADRKPFGPECATNVLQDCGRDALVNAYDNSIAYTDHVVAKAIAWLLRQAGTHDPSLLYVSDHGESLGEGGIYLHGLPYAFAPQQQKHVPLVLWWPAQTEAGLGVSRACLHGRQGMPLSHDHLFHTVLAMAGVRAAEYRSSLDLMEPCRAA
jgi:lipid A ethanolaminephosphotransferase